jgi:hypothetical protein
MISTLKKILFFTTSFIFTALLFFGLFLYFFGIDISTFSYKNVLVNGLYIKLDKKLIVKIDKLVIPDIKNKNANKNSLDEIQKELEYIPILKKYFTLIDIKDLVIGKQHMVVSYNNENIYFDNELLNISVKPEFLKKSINLNLYSLYLKDYKMMFDGEIKIDLIKKSSFLTGNFYYKDIDGTVNSIVNKKTIEFHIDSSSMKNIKFVKDFVRLNKTIEAWMYDNVSGKFKLNYLTGIVDISKQNPKLIKLEGDAQVENATIIYHKDLKPIKTKLLSIVYKNDNLSFKMKNPTYNGIKVYGSDVVISSLMGSKPNIAINIKTNNKLTKDIVNIVQAYGGDLPIVQTSGSTNSKLAIKIDLFGKFKTNLYGEFKTKNSEFKIKNFKFKAINAVVKLNNDKLNIKNSTFKYDNNLFAKLDLDINLKTKKAIGTASNIRYDLVNNKYKIIDIKNLSSKLKVDFQKRLNIFIDKLNLSLSDNQKQFTIHIKDINKIYIYSPFLQKYKISKGDMVLNIDQNDKIKLNAKIEDIELPLVKNKKPIRKLDLIANINRSKFYIKTTDNSIKYNNISNLLELNNLTLLYDSKSSNSNNKFEDINIKGKNTNILIDNQYKLLSEEFNIKYKNNNLNSFVNRYKKTTLRYLNNKTKKTIVLNNVTPEFFKSLTTKEFVRKGSFDLNGLSTNNIFEGKIILNNLLIEPKAKAKATIQVKDKKENTTLDNYFITHGTIKYKYNTISKYLDMYDIKTKGKGIDLDGAMNINFLNENINGVFNAVFFKDASEFISKIPLFNYIILGQDQKFSIKAKLKGKFDDINITTNTASSAVKAPVSIIGRIITLPVKAIEKIGETLDPKEK